jgi:GT2 family glycosyltransferase
MTAHTDVTHADVTLVVVPRERFSAAQASLESIYANTRYPFKLVYVDGRSPRPLRRYLQQQAQARGFELIRTNTYLSPNQARNLGMGKVDTKYVVFIDNDVLVTPGWLEKLVQCAEDTDAWIVGPLCCEGEAFSTVHILGGFCEFKQVRGQQWLIERRPFMKLPLQKVKHQLKKEAVGLIEFHCVLARTDVFKTYGPLDEALLSMAEETDFSLTVLNGGKQIYVEPESVVSYLPPFQLAWSDLPYFFLRWSDTWCEGSVQRMQGKWQLDPNTPVLNHYRDFVREHRKIGFAKPLALLDRVKPLRAALKSVFNYSVRTIGRQGSLGN